MPDVREGSVIEYKFILESDYISNLYEWHFQEDIPVRYSSYKFLVPEFFIYNHRQLGNVVQLESESEYRDESFIYSYTTSQAFQPSVKKKATLPSRSQYQQMTTTNIKALQNEPLMNNRSILPSRIESQLITVKMPNSAPEQVARTYEQFSNTLLDWGTFGAVLSGGGFAKEKISTMSPQMNSIDKVNELYNWIRSSVTFNNVYGFSSSNSNRKLFREGKGSVADINLTLIAVLRQAGIEANPVILSTRGSGVPHPVYPSYEDFNYVIAGIEVDDKFIMADATSQLPLGAIPSKCMNWKGWLVSDEGEGRWIDLKAGAKESYTVQTDISFDNGEILKTCNVKFGEYALYKEMGKLLKSEEDYRSSIASNFSSDNVEINSESNGLKWKVESSIDMDDEIVYLNPIEYGAITDNPFKRETRFSNVDFNYGISRTIIAKVVVPDGYSAELPEPTAIGLPNRAGRFVYSIQKNGNIVTVLSQYSLKETEFTAGEYPALKQFYQLMVDKNNEPIVIKKL